MVSQPEFDAAYGPQPHPLVPALLELLDAATSLREANLRTERALEVAELLLKAGSDA